MATPTLLTLYVYHCPLGDGPHSRDTKLGPDARGHTYRLLVVQDGVPLRADAGLSHLFQRKFMNRSPNAYVGERATTHAIHSERDFDISDKRVAARWSWGNSCIVAEHRWAAEAFARAVIRDSGSRKSITVAGMLPSLL